MNPFCMCNPGAVAKSTEPSAGIGLGEAEKAMRLGQTEGLTTSGVSRGLRVGGYGGGGLGGPSRTTTPSSCVYHLASHIPSLWGISGVKRQMQKGGVLCMEGKYCIDKRRVVSKSNIKAVSLWWWMHVSSNESCSIYPSSSLSEQ